MILRRFEPSDAATILGWIDNELDMCKWSADRYKSYPALPQDMIELYDVPNLWPMTALADDGKVVGHVMLRKPDPAEPVVRLGFVIVDNSQRNKGYGREMLRMSIDYARNELGAMSVTLGVFDNNPSAKRCYESVGFLDIHKDEMYPIMGDMWRCIEMSMNL